jgi:hypothetical protein
MSMANIDSLLYNECKLWFHGSDANNLLIKPTGGTITPNKTFVYNILKDNDKCLKFDGSSYLTIPNSSDFSFISGDFTMIIWARTTTLASNGAILSKYVTWSTNCEYYIYFKSSNSSIYCGIGPSVPVVLESSCLANTWYFITIVRTGTTYKLYVNGIFITSVTNSVTLANNANIILGTNISNNEFLSGNLKDFMIFKKALTLDQIGALMDETYMY